MSHSNVIVPILHVSQMLAIISLSNVLRRAAAYRHGVWKCCLGLPAFKQAFLYL